MKIDKAMAEDIYERVQEVEKIHDFLLNYYLTNKVHPMTFAAVTTLLRDEFLDVLAEEQVSFMGGTKEECRRVISNSVDAMLMMIKEFHKVLKGEADASDEYIKGVQKDFISKLRPEDIENAKKFAENMQKNLEKMNKKK